MEKFLNVFLAKPTKFSFFKDILYQFNLFFFVYNGAYYFKIMFQQFSYNFVRLFLIFCVDKAFQFVILSVAEFKEFKRRFKFKPRFKYG